MKKINTYNEYINEGVGYLTNRREIREWLDKRMLNINNSYKINDDLSVDIFGNFNIDYPRSRRLKYIPVKFNIVNGDFKCSNNLLETLENSPKEVYGNFNCSINNINTLYGCPRIVTDKFVCNSNYSLENINDLDSKILINNLKTYNLGWLRTGLNQKIWDDYFINWIDKDPSIVSVLHDKVSDEIKEKYYHYFNANNFDLI